MPTGGGGTPNFVNTANRALGRISGPLLADNLLRNGVDLAFETQLLYIDVKNKRIGVKYGSPTVELFINNTTNTTNLRVPYVSAIGDFVISTNQIQHSTGSITIQPNQSSNPTVTTPGLSTANLYLYGNTISSLYISTNVSTALITQDGHIFVANDGTSVLYTNVPELVVGASNINFTAQAAGDINLTGNTTVTGDLHATGNITWDGNLQFGDNLSQDTVTFGAEIASNIIPNTNNVWNLGQSALRWSTIYANTANSTSITTINLAATNFTGSGTNALNGNVIIGATDSNTLTVTAKINSDLIPSTTNAGNLGQNYEASVPSGGSLTFSSGNYLALNDPQTIGTQSYTFECFFYTASNGLQTLLGAANPGGMSIWLFGNGINPVTIIQIDRSYVDAAQYTVSPITINTWHHIAVTRNSANNTSVFLDGVKATGSASNTTNYTGPSGLIGAVAGSSYFFTGYLTQIKLTIGSNYYDPTESSISVPTAPLTTGANTKLLLIVANSGAYLTDASGTQILSNISGVTYSTSTPLAPVAEKPALYWNNVYGVTFNNGNITLTTNTIQTNTTNSDLRLVANGSGAVVFSKLNLPNSNNINIGGTLAVTGTTALNNNVATDAITQTGSYNVTGNAALGTVSSGNITAENPLTLPTITINGSVITGTASGSNLKLTANTGQTVEITSATKFNNNVLISGTLAVTGTTSLNNNVATGAITQLGNWTQSGASGALITGAVGTNNIAITGLSSQLILSNFTIYGNTVAGTVGNQTVQYTANGAGSVNVEYLKFNNNNITNIWPSATTDTQKSILFTPNGTGNVEINSTKSLILPIGNNSTRVLASNGETRYNSLYNNIEGYSNTGYVNFFNLYSQDQQTYATAELTPNAADSTLRFAIGNVVTTTISSSTLTTVNLVPGNVGVSVSTVQNTQTNTDVAFVPNGTGKINLKSFVNVKDNTVTNATSTNISFDSTNQGHWKFGGKSGVVIPLGTNSDYPITALQGAIRYNTVSGFAEVYTGSVWTSWVGTGNATVSESDMNDLTFLYTLILG
jgi:hypothetical protein